MNSLRQGLASLLVRLDFGNGLSHSIDQLQYTSKNIHHNRARKNKEEKGEEERKNNDKKEGTNCD